MRKYIVLIIIALSAAACGHRTAWNAVKGVEGYIEERPDSALAVLQAVDKNALNTSAKRARYALWYSIALDKNYIDVTDDSLIINAVRYYDVHKRSPYRSKAYYYLGRVYQNAENMPSALVSFKNTIEYADSTDYHLLGLAYRGLTDVCTQTYRNGEALEYAERAYKYFAKGDRWTFTHYAMMDYAVVCHNVDSNERASALYSMTIDSALLYQEKSLYANAARRYAYHLKVYSNPDSTLKSQKLFKEAIEMAPGSFTVLDYTRYADLEFAISNIENGERLLAKARNKAKTIVDTLNICNSEGKKLYVTGNYKAAYDSLFSSIEGQSRVFRKMFNSSAFQAEKDMYREQAVLADYKLRITKVIITMVMIIALLLIIILSKAIMKRIGQKDRQIEESRDIIRNLEISLFVQKQRNEIFYNQIKAICGFEFAHLDKILVDYDTYSRSESKREEVLAAVGELVKSVRSPEKYKALEALVNACNDNLMEELRSSVAAPDDIYYKIACYYFCGFTTSFISMLTGLSHANLYNRKKRLKDRIKTCNSSRKEEMLEKLGSATNIRGRFVGQPKIVQIL